MLLRIIFIVIGAFSMERPLTTDVHVHTSAHGQFGLDIPGILESMEQNQIDRSFILSAGYTYGFNLRTKSVEDENDFIAEQVKLHPDKFVGICSVPFYYKNAL